MRDSFFPPQITGIFISLFLAVTFPLFADPESKSHPIFLASSDKDLGGLYHMNFNSKTGNMSLPKLVHSTQRLGFLAKHPELPMIYGACQNQNKQDVIKAFDVSAPETPKVSSEMELNLGSVAHLAVHPSGRLLIMAHYGAGGISVLGLNKDGSFLALSTHLHKGGSKVVVKRQSKPHPHWVGFSPDGRFALVTDLGTDQIHVYSVDIEKQALSAVHEIQGIPGGGPRHMRFSVDGKFIYLLNELTSSVSVFRYDSETGIAQLTSTTPALNEKELAGNSFNSSSEILVHPSGNWVYSGNRGHDSVSIYKVSQETESLERLQVEPVRGAWPRNIQLDPSGNWLLAAGADSHTVSVFAIHPKDGTLTFLRKGIAHIPQPICILFMR